MGELGVIFTSSSLIDGEFIIVDSDDNSIKFKIQQGPIKENGVNGCQVDSLVAAARKIIAFFNDQYPCRENALALTKLDEAGHWMDTRTKNRTKRGVEGKNER